MHDNNQRLKPIGIPQIPEALVSCIENHSDFLLVGHKEPDGDCIGSSLAMKLFLERRGKNVTLLNDGPFDRAETRVFEPLFLKTIPQGVDKNRAVLIVLDCSSLDRVGQLEEQLKGFETVFIDHHATNNLKDPTSIVMTSSPSTTYIVQALIEHIGGEVTSEEAEVLFFGLCTDTGFFRHLDSRSANVFAFASRLVAKGANPKTTFDKINGGKSFGSRILIARILERLTPHYNGRLMVSYETYEETQAYGQQGRDTDSVYRLIQGIENVEAIVVVRQESPTHCTVGFRSVDKIDVSVIAATFGGGGHAQASGLYIEGKYDELLPRFVQAFESQFAALDNQSKVKS